MKRSDGGHLDNNADTWPWVRNARWYKIHGGTKCMVLQNSWWYKMHSGLMHNGRTYSASLRYFFFTPSLTVPKNSTAVSCLLHLNLYESVSLHCVASGQCGRLWLQLSRKLSTIDTLHYIVVMWCICDCQ